MEQLYDAVVVGGGPAGLTAAVWLGRARRRVLLIDANTPRNGATRAVHGFLGHEGISPGDLRRRGREALAAYDVTLVDGEVADVQRGANGLFEVQLDDGRTARGRKLLLATGLVDRLPAIAGLRPLYGRSVFHCPYCDGWEVRGQPIAVYGRGRTGLDLARVVRCWTEDVVLLTGGVPRLGPGGRELAARMGVRVVGGAVDRLEGHDGILREIVMASGERIPRRALFFHTSRAQQSPLAARLGCRFDNSGRVRASKLQASGVDGLYVAGDAVRDVQFAIVAAAEGARAAYAINRALIDETW